MVQVIYEKETKRVLVYNVNGVIVLPEGWELRTYNEGVDPVMVSNSRGELFLKENAIVLSPNILDE